MSTTLKPGDGVRATVEATVISADGLRVLLETLERPEGYRLIAYRSGGWSFDIIPRVPVVGDVIPRDDVNNYDWWDGAVLRTIVPNAPIHRAGAAWRFGDRFVDIRDFPEETQFDVLAVGA